MWDCLEFFEGTRFPEPRPEQSQVIPQATNLIEQGYKNIIVECPTGSGKSAMAMMLPKIFNSDAYVVTHLKGLQEQYMREMPFMRSVMGKGNYDCSLDLEPGCLNKAKAQEAVDKAKIGGFTWQTGGCTAVETGNPAGYSYRKDSSDDLVLIGEKKEYKPLSREAFVKKMVNRNKK